MISTHLVPKKRGEEIIDWVLKETRRETDALGFIPSSGVKRHADCDRLIVARHSGQLAGFVLFGGKNDANRIFQIYVPPALRRRGIATALVERVKLWGTERGVPSTRARVASDLPAVAFWESLGWQPIEIARGGARRGRLLVTFESQTDLKN